MKDQKVYRSGILLYPGVEILNVAGPAEVFAATAHFKVITLSLTTEPIRANKGFTLVPDYELKDSPLLDVLVIPGGCIEKIQDNEEVLRWLKAMSIKTNLLLSVCTGAYLLAAAGLLDGKIFTTHHEHIDSLQQYAPYGKAIRGPRYTDSGNIIATAGVSAGIEGALHVVRRLRGVATALHTAASIEFPYWQQTAEFRADTNAATG
ncbi:DJ-1/PfpI family protein [Cesiribacter sp. SM1]|uniref:DJ-1/PfpI family protein n=1 Tax=Cesiribacter sp. SM1 TaxID=2861196 RepID=UPI001CD7C7F9|nr:DJ-1/PfpI family protein [Cesiribacter sp. SM1]